MNWLGGWADAELIMVLFMNDYNTNAFCSDVHFPRSRCNSSPLTIFNVAQYSPYGSNSSKSNPCSIQLVVAPE